MKKNNIVLSAIVVLVVAWLGYSVFYNGPSAGGALKCDGCNVIVIGVDTLRADHVHALGYSRETTPTLDALAAKGYLFSNAISAASWTVPGFMSVMTGVFPSVHKVVNKFTVFTPTKQVLSNLRVLSPEIMTLAEVMKSAGYATGGFTGDAGVSGKFGYSQGFDAYTDETTFGKFANSDTHALQWLDSLPKGQKFFMFFHGYDLHGQAALAPGDGVFVPAGYAGPYKGTTQEEAKLREDQLVHPLSLTAADAAFWTGLYDSKLKAADAELAKFLDQLKQRGLLDNTVIVVLSDHGEEYYEHGGIDHGHSLYDELIHVPVIMDIPNAKGGEVIPAQVSTMDVGPALLNIVGVTAPAPYAAQTAGRPDLLAYLKNPATPGYSVFSETDYRGFTHKRSIRTADGWKYILTLETHKEELYNLASDPGERTNLIGDQSDAVKAEELRTALRDHLINDLRVDPSAPVSNDCLPVYQGECQ